MEKRAEGTNKALIETSEAQLDMTLLHVFQNPATEAQIKSLLCGRGLKQGERQQAKGGGEEMW